MDGSRTYEVEDLLEMLGGDKYYSMDNIMYVYHTLRNETDEADYYMEILKQKEKALEKKLNKIKKLNGSQIPNDNYYQPLATDDDNSSSGGGFDESKGSEDDGISEGKSER